MRGFGFRDKASGVGRPWRTARPAASLLPTHLRLVADMPRMKRLRPLRVLRGGTRRTATGRRPPRAAACPTASLSAPAGPSLARWARTTCSLWRTRARVSLSLSLCVCVHAREHARARGRARTHTSCITHKGQTARSRPADGGAEVGGEARAGPVEPVLDQARQVAVLVREPGFYSAD